MKSEVKGTATSKRLGNTALDVETGVSHCYLAIHCSGNRPPYRRLVGNRLGPDQQAHVQQTLVLRD
jgi:hypothetical protein